MTIREMQIFLEVARTCNMSAAGKNLYLSQSTVSQAVLLIEKRYRVSLFRRQGKRLVITHQGEVLQGYCRQILELHRKLEYDLQHSEERVLRIGTNLITARSIFGSIWNRYHLRCPDVQTQVSLEENEALVLRLHNFELDAVIMDQPARSPELLCEKIADDEYMLICAKEHPLHTRRRISLCDLQGTPLLMLARETPTRELFEDFFRAHSLTFPIREFGNIDIIKAKVIANEGLSIMASGQFRLEAQLGYLHGITLSDASFQRHFYVLRHRDLPPSPCMDDFLEVCAQADSGTPRTIGDILF